MTTAANTDMDPQFSRRGFLKLGLISTLGTAGALSGCSDGAQKPDAAKKPGEVVVLSWGGPEFTDKVGNAFKAKTGVSLRMVSAGGDSEFLSKVKSGGGDEYDVVITNVGFVETLDLRDFKSTSEISPEFINDPRFGYLLGKGKSLAFPNQWGAYGLTFNPAKFTMPSGASWNSLWDAPKGSVILDGFYVTNIAMAGRASGLSWGESFDMSGDTLKKAVQLLKDLKPFLLATSDPLVIDAYLTEKVVAGMVFSLGLAGTVNRQAKKNLLQTVVPTEGVIGALDGQMIVKGARNRENAKLFIDFLGSSEGQLIMWDLFHSPTSNKKAMESILSRGGLDADLLRSQQGDSPKAAAALTQLKSPTHAAEWNLAWDEVLAG
jgi:spermidine/putrescine transport system substrate-binding protein